MMNFLLVDDHTLIRTALKIILHNAYKECAIDEASDSDSAIA